MRPLHIGIVGSGGMAAHHARAFPSVDGTKVAVIASRNPDTGSALAKQCGAHFTDDWRALCADPNLDAVVICTHNDTHGEIAVGALRAGKHVYVEYPLARAVSDGEHALALATEKALVLRVSHREPYSSAHQALRAAVARLGKPLLASFIRLTPSRGARPEVLFNVPVSGPPAHFFAYQVFPIVDLFGPAAWVEGGAVYEGVRTDGRYDLFVNTVNVGFRNGGLGQWTWSGGIEIAAAEQHERFVFADGTLVKAAGDWQLSTRAGVEPLQAVEAQETSLHRAFVREVRERDLASHAVAATALETVRISLGAELAMNENRRVLLT